MGSPERAPTIVQKFIDDMERDLPKWKEVGKMTDVQVAWWKDYIQKSRVTQEARPPPLAPTILPTYRLVAAPPPRLDHNIERAIQSHMDRLDRSSQIRVAGRRLR